MATSSEGEDIKEEVEEGCGEEGQYSVGWKFCPTDAELIAAFLLPKNLDLPLPSRLIKDVDFYSSYPWDLHRQFRLKSVKECYFFTRAVDVTRSNGALSDGFWAHLCTNHGDDIGLRRTLSFQKGSIAKSVETDWVVHEYQLNLDLDDSDPWYFDEGVLTQSDGWLLCKLFNSRSSNDDERQKAASLVQRDLYTEWLRRSEQSNIIV